MFRLNVVDGFTVKVLGADGPKPCRIRYPKDQEWCQRIHRVRVIRTNVGRDLYESDVPQAKQDAANLELLNLIRLDKDGPVFDAAEAADVIDRIDRSRIVSTEREGQQFIITFEVAKETTVHRMRIPAPRDLRTFEESRMHISSGKRHTEIRSSLEPAGDLYNKCLVSVEGYAAEVPITHKFAVVNELADQVATATDELEIELPEG
jgi:hypothetical protein